MRKFEIALLLAQKFGYTSYLEICSSTTGGTYTHVDKEQFTRRMRVMYRCPPGFADGEVIDLSTEDESGEKLFGDIIKSGEKFDVVFIDPFHTYETSLRDIVYGMQLVKSGGIILIHDCLPPDAETASPVLIPGSWCGVTYAAFLDIVLFANDISYCTVDSDYGCGIVSKDDRLAALVDSQPSSDLIAQWGKLNFSEKYPFFEKHSTQLLRLLSPDNFRQRLLAGSFRTSLERIKEDLNTNRKYLEDTRTDLNHVRNTYTWKVHEHIHNISFIRNTYLSIVMPLRKWLQSKS